MASFVEGDDEDDLALPPVKRPSASSEADAAALEAETRKGKGGRAGGAPRRQHDARQADRARQAEGLRHLRRGQRPHARGRGLDRSDRRLAVRARRARHRGRRRRRHAPPRHRRRAAQGHRRSRRKKERRRGRRGRGVRVLAHQRSRPHVPAQDGLGLAAHPRGRGRDRQAHRGRRAQDAPGRAQLSVAVEELLAIGERLRHGKIRVKDVVKDIDEDEAEFDEQCLRRPRLQDHRQGQASSSATPRSSRRSSTRPARPRARRRRPRRRSSDNRAQMFEELSDLRLNKPTVDRIVVQLKNIIVKLDKAELESPRVRAQARGDGGERDPQDAARDARDRRRGRARSARRP